MKAWSWIASGCHSWVALLHSIHFWRAAAVGWPAPILRCNSSLLLLYALCKAVRWSLAHPGGPLGAGMTSDGCQEAKCQDQLRCTGAGAYWCMHEHYQVMCSARLAGPLWTGTQSCTDLLSYLVASSSLQAEDRAEQHPGVVTAFSVPARGGSPATTQGSCSSGSPSRGSQVWASCFFLSPSLTSHRQAKKKILGNSSWVRLVGLFCFHDAAGFFIRTQIAVLILWKEI